MSPCFGVRRFDAGRIVPANREVVFALRGAFAPGPHMLVLRSDETEARSVELGVGGETQVVGLSPAIGDAWGETRARLPVVSPGAVVRVRGLDGALRVFAFTLEP